MKSQEKHQFLLLAKRQTFLWKQCSFCIVVYGGVYTRDNTSPFLMQLNRKTRQIFWTAHMSKRHVQAPLIKIIVVSWCTDVVLSSSKQFMTVHELTWDKRSEIGGRSWVCDFGKNEWDRDQRHIPQPPCFVSWLLWSLRESLWFFWTEEASNLMAEGKGYTGFHPIPFL